MTGTGAETDDVARRIIEIIAEQAVLDPSEVTLEANPEALGVDSLGMVEAVFAIEESFDVSIPFNANDPGDNDFDISSVAAIVAGVKGLIEKQKG